MIWFCQLICWFPACCARSGCVEEIIMFVSRIIVNGVGASMGKRFFFLQSTCDRLGSLYEAPGMRNEALRCRLISEVHRSSGLKNRAETSGFYGADFLSGTGISTESVVLTRARDFISASSCRGSRCDPDQFIQGELRIPSVVCGIL
ncbi:hypothetical protein Enr17x_02240 [Gimesia fumaroli]|uniref:Uncharacterized protein n=1 Tax=Gimesia fumaroli TaxID=2527976 RepID=A0A518I578_9PLAN|nr:hypothetical protein Enr17x_02240 [Gimesia fumaroli]